MRAAGESFLVRCWHRPNVFDDYFLVRKLDLHGVAFA